MEHGGALSNFAPALALKLLIHLLVETAAKLS